MNRALDDDCSELSRAEMRAGRVSWDYMAHENAADRSSRKTAELQQRAVFRTNGDGTLSVTARRDEPGIYDELSYEPSGMPPEFWRGILFAAGAVSVFWVVIFFSIRAVIAS